MFWQLESCLKFNQGGWAVTTTVTGMANNFVKIGAAQPTKLLVNRKER
ncbi:MAG: hypothetical protein ACW980_23590 [Promethearchaeota archaeon]